MILLTFSKGEYCLMIIDDEGFETIFCGTYAEAILAKRAWEDFLNES